MMKMVMKRTLLPFAPTNAHRRCGHSLRVDDGKVTLFVHLHILIQHRNI